MVTAQPRRRGALISAAYGILHSSGISGCLRLVWEGKLRSPFGEVVDIEWLVGTLGAWSSCPQLGAGLGLGSASEDGALLSGDTGIWKGLCWTCSSCAGRERLSPCSCLLTLVAFRGTDVSAETSFPSADGPSPQPTTTQQGCYYICVLYSLFLNKLCWQGWVCPLPSHRQRGTAQHELGCPWLCRLHRGL